MSKKQRASPNIVIICIACLAGCTIIAITTCYMGLCELEARKSEAQAGAHTVELKRHDVNQSVHQSFGPSKEKR